MNDSWTDQPYALGVVFVGDAGGWNDPIIGQGLSIAMCDVRILTDLLCASRIGPLRFSLVTERNVRGRMRRLRVAARVRTTSR
jgi:2-polyprenyl-6-methoxyphenol hydroxylase-like FAD-dependent oxidoreductase